MSIDNLKKNIILTPFNIMYKCNPELTLKVLFRLKLGYSLRLENPQTYNEKLQWIKLHDRNPLMPKCCDKYVVRKYIQNKGYSELLNELLWEGYEPEKIPFDILPNQFVIKVTHGSTFNIICKDKTTLDKKATIKQCRKWLKAKFLPCYGEWFYGVEKPRVIVEKYLEGDEGMPLFDYKFFCFNGFPKMVYVDTWKDGKHAINAYDTDLNLFEDVKLGYPNDNSTIVNKPVCWERMLKIAQDLSKEFLHVRVDLYYTGGKIIFGELTFTKGAGFGKIEPLEFDYTMGSWLKLPTNGRN